MSAGGGRQLFAAQATAGNCSELEPDVRQATSGQGTLSMPVNTVLRKQQAAKIDSHWNLHAQEREACLSASDDQGSAYPRIWCSSPALA